MSLVPRVTSVRTLPRYIEPASIEIGDVIRVVWKSGDVEHSRTAQVVKREYDTGMRVLLAGDGQEIMRWTPYHIAPRVTLLSKAPTYPDTMLDMPEEIVGAV